MDSVLDQFECTRIEVYYLVGAFCVVTFIAHCPIRLAVDGLRPRSPLPHPFDAQVMKSAQGFIERFLYMTAWLVGYPELIAVWLALKVASQWKRWSEDAGYNTFLVGTALSVFWGSAGAWFWFGFTAFPRPDWPVALAGPGAVAAINVLLLVWLWTVRSCCWKWVRRCAIRVKNRLRASKRECCLRLRSRRGDAGGPG